MHTYVTKICAGRVPQGIDISVLLASRDSDRTSLENSSDEGGSEIRLPDPNSLDPSPTHIHHERLELENSHEVLRRLGLCVKSDIIIPKKGYICHEPPSGYFTTYLDHFSNGFSLPPNALLVDIVRSLGQQLEEKYSVDLTTGEHFLNSALGKTLLMSTGEKAVEGYRGSSAFRDKVLQQALTIHDQVVIDCRRQLWETRLVSEEIVRMIEPSVPEPGDENNEERLSIIDEILGDIDHEEMIEALLQKSNLTGLRKFSSSQKFCLFLLI
ncbi:ARM repeat-containing protein [Dorcoceras hygrometricum]|uniref:ARM repeat-containing protein n=1 Tax=Dorcoceras hygrometricum TaxID=472368 RepID=A0A2Z7DFK2_9LAMI|nr:ARM repeat-containing protein [Dorcoceras hygrometricum]